MFDFMPAPMPFRCGDTPECHADDHVNCTPEEGE